MFTYKVHRCCTLPHNDHNQSVITCPSKNQISELRCKIHGISYHVFDSSSSISIVMVIMYVPQFPQLRE